jgi:hypothetical protein
MGLGESRTRTSEEIIFDGVRFECGGFWENIPRVM